MLYYWMSGLCYFPLTSVEISYCWHRARHFRPLVQVVCMSSGQSLFLPVMWTAALWILLPHAALWKGFCGRKVMFMLCLCDPLYPRETALCPVIQCLRALALCMSVYNMVAWMWKNEAKWLLICLLKPERQEINCQDHVLQI